MVGSGVDLAVFAVLFYGTSLPLLAANSLGYGLAAVSATGLAGYHNIAVRDGFLAIEVRLFLGANLCGLGVTTLTLWLATGMVPVLAAKVLALTATTVWNCLAAAKFLPGR